MMHECELNRKELIFLKGFLDYKYFMFVEDLLNMNVMDFLRNGLSWASFKVLRSDRILHRSVKSLKASTSQESSRLKISLEISFPSMHSVSF